MKPRLTPETVPAKPEPATVEPQPKVTEPVATPASSPIVEFLNEEQLRELAEKPVETVVRINEGQPVESVPAEAEVTISGELPPEGETDKPTWVEPEKRRAADEAAGDKWEGPYPWEVEQRSAPQRTLPEKSWLEMPLIERERVTFESVNSPLSQAINLMVASTSFNVIIDDGVSDSKVTLSFRDTPLREALETLTAVNDLAFTLVHNTIIIGKRADIGRRLGGYVTRAFQLDYADAEAVKQVLLDNGLVTKENVGVYNGEPQALTTKLGGTALSTGKGGIDAGDVREIESMISTARRNTLIVTETPAQLEIIERVIADIDRKPKIVTLETSIVEVTEDGLSNLGFEYPNSISTTMREQSTPAPEGIPLGLWLQSMYRDPVSIIFKLNMQIKCGNARVLSRPNLSAVDGSQAIYFAGRLIPYISRPAVTTGATYTPPEVDFQAVGVTLSFKPRVDQQGDITIDVNPSVSTLLQFLDLGQGASAPETQTRQVTTTIRVRDQETFVIAGLLSEEERESLREIPLLSEIPLFGELFTSREKSRERTEIMVFVTPIVHE